MCKCVYVICSYCPCIGIIYIQGPACERNTCPVDDDGVECSGNGKYVPL